MYKLRSSSDYFKGNHIKFSIENILSKTNKPDTLTELFDFLLTNSIEVQSLNKKFYLIDARAPLSLLFLFPFHHRVFLYFLLSAYELEVSQRYKSPYIVKTNFSSKDYILYLASRLANESISSRVLLSITDLSSANNLFRTSLSNKIYEGTLEQRLEYLFSKIDVDSSLSKNFIKIAVENSRYFAASVVTTYFAIPNGDKILTNIEAWLSQNTLIY